MEAISTTKDCILITFASTHSAIEFERTAKEMGVPMRLIPTPRSISASCGLTARLDTELLATARRLAETYRIRLGKTYRKQGTRIEPEPEEE